MSIVSRRTSDELRSNSRRPYALRFRLWIAAAAVLSLGLMAAAVGVARANAHHAADVSQKAFLRESATIAATLQLAIQHENDLLVSAAGYYLVNPTGSQSEFIVWGNAVELVQRYPELQGIGVIAYVSAAQLPAFEARSSADPPGADNPIGAFTLLPPGQRAFYCLSAVTVDSNPTVSTPTGADACAGTGAGAEALLSSRESGASVYGPLASGNGTWLAIETPVYLGGITPTTVSERQDEFVGWVGALTEPAYLLAQALKGYPHVAVSMRYRAGRSDITFSGGHAPAGAQSITTDLDNGWYIQTSGAVAKADIFTDSNSVGGVLISGIFASLLLGLLVFLLGTGRERARRTVLRQTADLLHQAMHDSLTGLPNRALIVDRIEQLLARGRRRGTAGTALFIDIDDFKNVNDTMGHQVGDRLLVAVGTRLASTLRDADTIGRMGGDEFVVLIDESVPEAAPGLVATRLLDAMARPFELDGIPMPLTVSISIGIATGDRDSADELLRDADVALYQAKAAGKNRYATFDPETRSAMSRRIDLEFDLRSALTLNQFRLMYQPIYRLQDLNLIGVEALLRWDHPARGLISPDEFIPILEQTGQIQEVGRWVLFEACRQAATWHTRGHLLEVSVNVSGRQLDHDSIVDDIRNALREQHLDPAFLIIEITETALMRNVEATIGRLELISALGVRISVDDFGTGYSSLAYLRQFPVYCLKIDRVFTNAITKSPESVALVNTVVQLGKDLGLTTLAEGVETAAEMELLKTARVDLAQGFLMARPLDPQTLEARLLKPFRYTALSRGRY